MLLMKRNGDALSIDDYDPLDLKHVLPWFIYSTSVTESLENTSAVSFWLYGFSVFSDAVYYSQVATSASGPVYYNNILYASGTVVYEKGTVELSQMKTPSSDNEKVHVYYVISFQLTIDFGPLRSVDFHLKSGNQSFTNWFNVTGIGYHQSACFGLVDLYPSTVYNVSVDYDYDYDSGKEHYLEIRMYTDNPVASWLKYGT